MHRYDEGHEEEILKLALLNNNPTQIMEIKDHYDDLDLPLNEDGSGWCRCYHSWDHILDVLTAILGAREAGQYTDFEVFSAHVTAALFHDIWYTPGAPSGENEQKSSDILEEMVKLSKRHMPLAHELILVTADHGKLERRHGIGRNKRLFLDADIAGLGCEYPRFIVQNEEVDAEFQTVYSEEQVAEGRKKFLQSMLAKETIYLTDYFGSQLEWKARSNIQRLLEEMA
jgi:predicted metal-dependent HD superfamily phosphohydrolase